MKKQLTILLNLIFILALSIPIIADATSGACSWHGGVDCSMGRQANGKVYCNDDGWTGSMVYYDFMVKCENSSSNSCWGYSHDCKYLKNLELLNYKKSIAIKMIDEQLQENKEMVLHWNDIPDNIKTTIEQMDVILTINKGYLLGNYMDYMCKCTKIDEILDQYARDSIGDIPSEVIENTLDMLGDDENNKNGGVKSDSSIVCPENSYLGTNSNCYCNTGYEWDNTISKCRLFEGALIRATNGINIYIVKYVGSKKFKRLILSPSVFNNYGHLRWEDVIDVDQATLNSFTTSDLVRAVGDDKIYWLYAQGDTGGKRLIKSHSVFVKYGLDTDGIYEINRFDRESYITDAVLE